MQDEERSRAVTCPPFFLANSSHVKFNDAVIAKLREKRESKFKTGRRGEENRDSIQPNVLLSGLVFVRPFCTRTCYL